MGWVLLILFWGLILLGIAFAWADSIDKTSDWDPKEEYDFWMIDD